VKRVLQELAAAVLFALALVALATWAIVVTDWR
jgi:hypothetical protein